jgi:hypothetical protein
MIIEDERELANDTGSQLTSRYDFTRSTSSVGEKLGNFCCEA